MGSETTSVQPDDINPSAHTASLPPSSVSIHLMNSNHSPVNVHIDLGGPAPPSPPPPSLGSPTMSSNVPSSPALDSSALGILRYFRRVVPQNSRKRPSTSSIDSISNKPKRRKLTTQTTLCGANLAVPQPRRRKKPKRQVRYTIYQKFNIFLDYEAFSARFELERVTQRGCVSGFARSKAWFLASGLPDGKKVSRILEQCHRELNRVEKELGEWEQYWGFEQKLVLDEDGLDVVDLSLDEDARFLLAAKKGKLSEDLSLVKRLVAPSEDLPPGTQPQQLRFRAGLWDDWKKSYLVSSGGRPRRFGPEVDSFVLGYVKERNRNEKIVTRALISRAVSRQFDVHPPSIRQVSIIMARIGLGQRKKTVKKSRAQMEEEEKPTMVLIGRLKTMPRVIVINIDETPVARLWLPQFTIVEIGAKFVTFEDGGRPARATTTMTPLIWAYAEYGKIVDVGTGGCGVLFRKSSKASVVPGETAPNRSFAKIPQFWRSKKSFTPAELRNELLQFACWEYGKGTMVIEVWMQHMQHFLRCMSVNVMRQLQITPDEYVAIPKVMTYDGHGGHDDRIGEDRWARFCASMKTLHNVETHCLPPGRTDEFQPLDLCANGKLKATQRELSLQHLEEYPVTQSGKLQLPGKMKLVSWMGKMFASLTAEDLRVSFARSGLLSHPSRTIPVVWQERAKRVSRSRPRRPTRC